MEILVVGAGAMGSLFSRYLSERYCVSVHDVDRGKVEELSKKPNIKPQWELKGLSKFDSALVCVPISKVASVLEVLSREMRGSSTIMEISSVKSPVIGAMRKLKPKGILGISFHPLFGPGLRELSFGRAVVIEVTDLEEETSYLSSLFPFKLIPMSLEDHDRAMAWLGLIHLIANAFLSSSDAYAEVLSSASTTTISWFLRVAMATLTQGEDLSQELITQNPYFEDCLRNFLADLRSRDFRKIREKIKRWLEEINPEEAYKLLYAK
ncbi:MAG: prephenate dehydrogenase/arogenate dehydrogenase family protein [Candidatus Korarchaeum sp.]|nr:prephenate dehydrogenase/arogenate dehydrogenase family protein [Candidatus Korarchaeum sp.]MDW8035770.1 prephenate dehydrogenase/arogenate dehydrogenase family protein [Candidatus Korarchaeum sp.]